MSGIPILGAATNALTNIVGTGMQNRANRKLAEGQQQWNHDMWYKEQQASRNAWNKQNAWDLKMWKLNNEYNSPIEQMARFKEAGLNPNLIYGKGTPGNSSMMSSNKMDVPAMKGYTRAQSQNILKGIDVFGQYQQMVNLQAQTNNVEANTNNTNQQAANAATMGEILQTNLSSKNQEYKYRKGQIEGGIGNYSLSIARANADMAKLKLLHQPEILANLRKEGKLKDQKLLMGNYGIDNNTNPFVKAFLSPQSHQIGNKVFDLGKTLWDGWEKYGIGAFNKHNR